MKRKKKNRSDLSDFIIFSTMNIKITLLTLLIFYFTQNGNLLESMKVQVLYGIHTIF